MLSEFQKHIEITCKDLKTSHIGVAISGGVDSIVLAHLLHKCECNISLLHCNFNLRGTESDGDQFFVEQLSKRLKVPYHTKGFNTESYCKKNKLSIQEAARNLRYEWFNEVANNYNLDFVATAHHADDNLETFFINLLRGTGIEGLTGIPKQNANIVRPLLKFSKKDILNYAKQNDLEWREDASNKEKKYVRNKLRHDVIPVLKEIQPAFLQNLESTLTYLQQSNAFLKEAIAQKKEALFVEDEITNGYKIDVEKLKQDEHVDLLIFELFSPYGFTAFADIKNLINAQSGKKVVSSTHIVLKNRNYLLLCEKNILEINEVYTIHKDTKSITIDGYVLHFSIDAKIENGNVLSAKEHQNTLFLDLDAVSFPLYVRRKEKGDYFYPSGMKGKKKLSKYFKDEKMSLLEKEAAWLLCNETEVIWVIGKRTDRRFAAIKETKRILKITYEKKY